MFLRDLSFRVKLPLCMITASIITAIVAIITVSSQYYASSKNSHIKHNQELGNLMHNMLARSLNHDDVWHAYSLLRGRVSALTPKHTLVVFNNQQTVFASNRPNLFPTGMHISNFDTTSTSLHIGLKEILGIQKSHNLFLDHKLLSSVPLQSDDIVIGYLVIVESYTLLTELLHRISQQAFFAILITIGILTPIAWVWGKNIVRPLLNLESCILRIGKEPLRNIECLVPDDRDEIGRLSTHFHNMLIDLKKTAELEKQIIRSDRIAAVGTLAAGVAHEINNPLAGMIVSVDNFKQYCNSPDCTQRQDAHAAVDLVERGLAQIRQTVSALLVNVNINDKPVSHKAIEDVHKLVLAKSNTKAIDFEWENEFHDNIAIPSTPIRQILINLLLNAIHATEKQGKVACHIRTEKGNLLLSVKNNGKSIDEKHMEHLFEPFFSNSSVGSGLGLWVTYQLVKNLKGNIEVQSGHKMTIFDVVIPATDRGTK